MTSLTNSNPIEYLKKEAKAVLKSVRSHEVKTCEFVKSIFPDLENLTLMNAQHVIAVKYGFKKWEDLTSSSPIQMNLAITMARIPELTSFGIGLYSEHRKLPVKERQAKFEADREELRTNHVAVEETVKWIKDNLVVIKTINDRYTSYGLKHTAEHDIGYVTNGVFIAAAVISGVPYKLHYNSPNVTFAVSTKTLRQVHKRQRSTDKKDGTLISHYPLR